MRIPEDEATLMEVDAFYERVHGIMVRRGLEWKDLSLKMGIDDSAFTEMREERRVPTVFLMRRIADALGVTLDELFMGHGLRDSYRMYWASPSAKPMIDELAPSSFSIHESAYYMMDGWEALDDESVCVKEILNDLDDFDLE